MLSVFEQACVLVILQAVNEFEDLTLCGEAVRADQGSDVQAANLVHNCAVWLGNSNTPAKGCQKCWFYEQLRQQLRTRRSKSYKDK